MKFKYNDYVLCHTNFGNIIAKFIADRTDKKTILVDYETRIHELPRDQVIKALDDEVESYFNQKTGRLTMTIEQLKKQNADYQNDIKKNSKVLKTKKESLEKLNDSLNSKKVMLDLVKSQNEKLMEEESLIHEINDIIDWIHIKDMEVRNLQHELDSWRSTIACNKLMIKQNDDEYKVYKKLYDQWKNVKGDTK
jgi:chromosome segregation ATPase